MERKLVKEPLVRITKREDISKMKALKIRVFALLIALSLGGLIILVLGHNPFSVYWEMIKGAASTKTSRIETIKIAIPLLGAAIAIAPAFRMKFWNIGAEGQILAGAIAATYFALFFYDAMPRTMLLVVMFLAAAAAGGIVGLIPAVFKAKWGTNETLFTLMLNYILLGFVRYLQNGPWRDPKGTGFPIIAMFDKSARLPKIFGIHIGIIIVVLLVIGMFVYLKYSKQGYEIAVVGESEKTARYAGMNVTKIIVRTMFISGAIAGIIGYIIASGADYTLNEGTAGGVGFTAITVAWLSKLNPFSMVFIALGLALLTKGSNTIQTSFKIPASASSVLIGIILFAMLSCEFFISYRLIFRSRKEGVRNDNS